jgi:CoA:oxalate CoA-transferase
MLSMQLTGLARYAAEGEAPRRVGNRHPVTTPVDVFRARDGHVAMVVPSDAQFRELAAIIGQSALGEDARYATNAARRANEPALRQLIESWTAARSVEEVIQACHARAIPAGPVRDLAQAWRSRPGPEIPHPAFGKLELALQPARFSGQQVSAAREPALGEHTGAVLGELLGLGQAEVEALRAEGAI